MDPLDLAQPLPDLLQAITDVESVSGNEQRLADRVEQALRACAHLEVIRHGNCLAARTTLGREQRILVAGHLDTVPVADNLPSSRSVVDGEDRIHGRGTCDMKGGVAVALQLAAELTEPRHDVTWFFYDNEEVASELNGLGRIGREHPELLHGDFAILMEPTAARIEGGCQGTMRFWITTRGTAAHSARSWLGHNAIHDIAPVFQRIAGFECREIEVEGLVFREGLNAVQIRGGVAGNVIPDECSVHVNYRYAPDKTTAQAEALMREVFDGFELEVVDLSPAARPGLDLPAAQDFVAAVGGEPGPKYGWTDVARFSELGVPAVNFGPANPGKAHMSDEYCPVADLDACADALRRWLAPNHDQEA
ncbi:MULTISPECIES: succinyl-diaminopimelate desuccinylase [unclassified Luteococcus]|uniref:succinyl-diaminopimelate desuccinylase n=1 Tax=unclassified Luteococcus TaxID=2639923 RepID=UPI00313E6394